MNKECILTCFIPVAMKETMTDLLLETPAIGGFSILNQEGYSRTHAEFDVNEQVVGFRKMCRFEMLLSSEEVNQVLISIQKLNLRHPIRYWVQHNVTTGHIVADD